MSDGAIACCERIAQGARFGLIAFGFALRLLDARAGGLRGGDLLGQILLDFPRPQLLGLELRPGGRQVRRERIGARDGGRFRIPRPLIRARQRFVFGVLPGNALFDRPHALGKRGQIDGRGASEFRRRVLHGNRSGSRHFHRVIHAHRVVRDVMIDDCAVHHGQSVGPFEIHFRGENLFPCHTYPR